MYSRKAWGGNVDPAITVKFAPHHDDHTISLIIFEFKDDPLIGRYLNEDDYLVFTFFFTPPLFSLSAPEAVY